VLISLDCGAKVSVIFNQTISSAKKICVFFLA
jgi:hypothetical protein